MVAGDDGAALHRCEQYLQGLLKGDEQMLLAWPVLSVNEVCHRGLEPWTSRPQARSATYTCAPRLGQVFIGAQCLGTALGVEAARLAVRPDLHQHVGYPDPRYSEDADAFWFALALRNGGAYPQP